jgi:hypothetical protein
LRTLLPPAPDQQSFRVRQRVFRFHYGYLISTETG